MHDLPLPLFLLTCPPPTSFTPHFLLESRAAIALRHLLRVYPAVHARNVCERPSFLPSVHAAPPTHITSLLPLIAHSCESPFLQRRSRSPSFPECNSAHDLIKRLRSFSLLKELFYSLGSFCSYAPTNDPIDQEGVGGEKKEGGGRKTKELR